MYNPTDYYQLLFVVNTEFNHRLHKTMRNYNNRNTIDYLKEISHNISLK